MSGSQSSPEFFIYDASSAQVSCAPCELAGLRRISAHGRDGEEPATYLPGDFRHEHPRASLISSDGGRVFFDASQPLVSQVRNNVQDVYEWEQAGVGSCSAGAKGGCIYLISGGVHR